jgi:hypothetical protein
MTEHDEPVGPKIDVQRLIRETKRLTQYWTDEERDFVSTALAAADRVTSDTAATIAIAALQEIAGKDCWQGSRPRTTAENLQAIAKEALDRIRKGESR